MCAAEIQQFLCLQALATSCFINDGISTPSLAITNLMDVAVDRQTKTVTMSISLTKQTIPKLIAAYRDMYPTFEFDEAAEAARLATLGGIVSRSARCVGSQGCHIIPANGSTELFFEPTAVASSLPPADTLPWPMGDQQTGPINAGAWAAVGDAAMSDPDAHTAAFLVVYKGAVVVERYGDGIGPATQLESWSMGARPHVSRSVQTFR